MMVISALSCLSWGSGWRNGAGGTPRELLWNCYCLSAAFSCCSWLGQGVGWTGDTVLASPSRRAWEVCPESRQSWICYAFAKDRLQSGNHNICCFSQWAFLFSNTLAAYKLHLKNYFEIVIPFSHQETFKFLTVWRAVVVEFIFYCVSYVDWNSTHTIFVFLWCNSGSEKDDWKLYKILYII